MFQLWLGRRKEMPQGSGRSRYRPAVEALEERALPSFTIKFMTSFDGVNYDPNGFFTKNPQAMPTLQAAAAILTTQLSTATPLQAIAPGGSNVWTASFLNPATGLETTIGDLLHPQNDLIVPQDTLIIFVGSGTLGGTEAGLAGPGGFHATGTQDFLNTVTARGQAGALPADDSQKTAFAPWGGSISFDGATNWNFSQDPGQLQQTQEDFFTVAEHEISHVLGFGTSPAWENNIPVNTSLFEGKNAEAEFGGPVPVDLVRAPNPTNDPNIPEPGHWQHGTVDSQPGDPNRKVVMDPILDEGTRVLFSKLDFAGLADTGWIVSDAALGHHVNQPPVVSPVTLADSSVNSTVTISVDTLKSLAHATPGPAQENNQTLTVTGVQAGQGGAVSLVGNNIVFTPVAGYSGPASFTYTVTDNGTTNGLADPKSTIGTVSFMIDAPVSNNPPPSNSGGSGDNGGGSSTGGGGNTGGGGTTTTTTTPIAVAPRVVSVAPNTPVSFTGKNAVAVVVHTKNSDVVTVTFKAAHGKLQVKAIHGLRVIGNSTGSLTLVGPAATVNSILKSLKFMPIKNFAGTIKVAFITSNAGHSATTMITINIRKH